MFGGGGGGGGGATGGGGLGDGNTSGGGMFPPTISTSHSQSGGGGWGWKPIEPIKVPENSTPCKRKCENACGYSNNKCCEPSPSGNCIPTIPPPNTHALPDNDGYDK